MTYRPEGPAELLGTRALRSRSSRFNQRTVAPYVFLALPVAVYGAFLLYPAFQLVILATQDWNGLGPHTFVGVANFVELFGDPQFWNSIGHNVLWMAGAMVVPVTIGLALAVFLSRAPLPGRSAFRTLYFVPQVISTVAVAVIWGWIYDPSFGALNPILNAVGLGGLEPQWLGDETLALPSIFIAWTWMQYGFAMVVLIASINAIDETYYDAAKVDGAGAWNQFRHVTLPALRVPLATVVLITAISSFQVFDLVFVMTNGGPGQSTMVLDLYMIRSSIQYQRVGYGAAIGVALASLVWVFSIVYLRVRGTFGQ